jgi:hypothetical protein
VLFQFWFWVHHVNLPVNHGLIIRLGSRSLTDRSGSRIKVLCSEDEYNLQVGTKFNAWSPCVLVLSPEKIDLHPAKGAEDPEMVAYAGVGKALPCVSALGHITEGWNA